MAARDTGGKARPGHGKRPLFIGGEIYRSSSYGARHPLAIPRVSTVMDLSRALGWLDDSVYLDSPRASPDELARFHEPAYVAAVMAAEARQRVGPDDRRRFNLGCNGNPVFPEMFRRPATACGGSLLGARLIAQSGTVYNPAGGTHHGRPAQANGFCYFNDPALAILALLDGGLTRVLYLDVDAHHGDGVQDAFAADPRVLTISLHEAGRWPLRPDHRAGTVQDRAGGQARNLPVPAGFNDSELDYVLEHAILPLSRTFAPEAVVLQAGADGLADDPMSRLELSNRALWRVVAAAKGLAPRFLVLGGGGYNPWSVARCWTGIWATLNGLEVPARLPEEAEAILRTLTWRHRLGRNPPEAWFTTLADRPRPGPLRTEVQALAAAVMDSELPL